MRNLQPLRSDLSKHLQMGFIISAGTFVLLAFFSALTGPSIAILAQSLAILAGFGEELRQLLFTKDRTPAYDDALVTAAGGLMASHLCLFTFATIAYVF